MNEPRRFTGLAALALAAAACTCNAFNTFPGDFPPDQDPPAPQIVLPPAVTGPEQASDSEFEPAPITNDEGGPVVITGEVAYTNPFFTSGVASPLIILEDQAGFVDRDEDFIMPVASQTLGQITSDFYQSPFSYSLALPIAPQGTLRDVDQDAETDTGVMVFAVAYWNNVWGDAFLEERDLGGGGWSTAYASTRVTEDPELEGEIIGGQLLVYALDNQQGFPSGFGEDGFLFTEDDPIVGLPQGYTIVDLDTDPFTFSRERQPMLDLYEPQGSALDDFSTMGYVAAFDAMLEKFRNEYAFTEYKNIDWDALEAEYRPRFQEAQQNNSEELYMLALRDFLWEIPDGHVAFQYTQGLFNLYQEQTSGGVGMAINELSDGSFIVVFVTSGGPAERAGIEIGAEILSINDATVEQALAQTTPWLGPFSTEHNARLGQLRVLTRLPFGDQMQVEYANPGQSADQATLTATTEQDSWLFWDLTGLTGYELPVQYRLLPSGHVYAQITSFLDNDLLSIQVWERLMRELNENNTRGLIIDLRSNGGGSGYLADQMAAYFFQEPLEIGQTGYYDEFSGEFYFDPDEKEEFILPPPELRYDGPVAAIVGPNCASACEFFAYNITLEDRAVIVGHYPTAGLGGGVEDFLMPPGITVRFTIGRATDAEGNIHIEGQGVAPDVLVPVTDESALGQQDVLLQAAIEALP